MHYEPMTGPMTGPMTADVRLPNLRSLLNFFLMAALISSGLLASALAFLANALISLSFLLPILLLSSSISFGMGAPFRSYCPNSLVGAAANME